MPLCEARPLKRRASSDVDDPPARCPPAPSQIDPATIRPISPVDNSPTPSSQSEPASPHLTIANPFDANDLPASQSLTGLSRLLVDPTLEDDTLPPLYSPPTSPCASANSRLPIPATSDIDSSPSAASPPPAPPFTLGDAISIHSSISSSPPSSPSRSHPAAPEPSAHNYDDAPPTPPADPTPAWPAEIEIEIEALCNRTHQDCLCTQAPRLELIDPCRRYAKNIVILVSTRVASPTRWSDTGSLHTYVLYGKDFVDEFKKSLPYSYSPVIRLKVEDDIPIEVRTRVSRAEPLPLFPRRPVAGVMTPLSTLAHMAAMFLYERDGINLVTTFSWREPRAVHTIDVIPRSLLMNHVQKAKKLADPSHISSDPVSEYTEPDSFPDEIDHDYPDI